jgi:hypothetical protein
MSELSMHELEAQTGEVLPEREALSVGYAVGSFNHRTTVNQNHITTANVNGVNTSSAAVANSAFSSATSSAGQTVIVRG